MVGAVLSGPLILGLYKCGYLLEDFILIFSGNLFPLGGSWNLLISLGSLALSLGTIKAMEKQSNVPWADRKGCDSSETSVPWAVSQG